MNLRTVFMFNALVAGFFAIVTLLLTSTMLSWYGVISTPEIILMTRFFGSSLVALSLLTFYLRNEDMSDTIKSVVLALLISDIVGLIVALLAQLSGILNSLGWTTVIIYGLLSVGYLSVYMKK